MTKYSKRDTEVFFVPKMPQANFLNSVAGVIQAYEQKDCIPYCLVKDDLPLILPKRADERTSGVGEGVNNSVTLENQYEVGAGSIVNQAISFLTIPRIGGNVTFTHTEKEVWTIVAVAAASITTGKYFEFDVIVDAGTITHYYAWFDKNGDGVTDKPAAPVCYGGTRTAVQLDISADVTAQEISDCITAAITALTDVAAANGGGTSTTVTVTNDNNGAVDDAHDVDSGLVVAITTQGRTKVGIVFDADGTYEQQNFGFHVQRSNGAYDIIYDLAGCSIAEHTLKCDSGGMMEEEPSYMVAGLKEQYGALTLFTKMRNAFGVQWAKGLSAEGNKAEVKNHGWHTVNKNFTLTYGVAAVLVTWHGFKIFIENQITHNRDGGGNFASGVDFNKRNTKITITVQPESHVLYQLSRTHITSYTGDLLIQIKSMEAGDNNVYVQFDCTKCEVLPFDEKINADGSPEKYDIDLIPAPGAAFGYTIEGYLSVEHFGGA